MATHAQRKRLENFRDYFRDNYAQSVRDPSEVREEMMGKFEVDYDYWYRQLPLFRDMIAEFDRLGRKEPPEKPAREREQQGAIIDIPAGIDGDVQAAVNKLLEENRVLDLKLAGAENELNNARSLLAATQGRVRLLKKLLSELTDAV